ncbi:hypothetical protein HYDPIDRAFT_118915 [Hydnomerulius pinastri MD-312]|uniref:Uncharacterized protein n=1 Tax=Hydnomerulius pinastri MD-312 TaxID=994086 RepID=A0A0C9VMU4_9AGAM|nr:hypothetical protein HYDPIDRAFT_118915 [Hydnomerulius pinastri MD-312]
MHHATALVPDDSTRYCKQTKALFKSENLNLDLRFVGKSTPENVPTPGVDLEYLDLSGKGHPGPATSCNLVLSEGQRVTFVLRICPEDTLASALRTDQERTDKLGVSLETTGTPGSGSRLTKAPRKKLYITVHSHSGC